jgi:exodeoxyribonuclease VII large subunit
MQDRDDSTALLPDRIVSVAGLNGYVQSLLEDDPQLSQAWVVGEVSSANEYRSGLFFTLQDPDAQASVQCVVWRSQRSRLMTVPTPGTQIIVLGQLRLYSPRGQYQFIVLQTIPAGAGLRALRYRQIRDRLQAEGVFDASRKRSLPAYPQVVAVVTSPQAAAWGDIQRTLQRRYPGLRVLLSPATVQGEQAPEAIAAAIDRVVRDGRAEVLILSRGGGATEDMSCFNDEQVVRAIAACPIPVVSGIGHQRDESLADLTADVCAHTPTAAAEQAVPELTQLVYQHQERSLAVQQAMDQALARQADRLQNLRWRLQQLGLDQTVDQQQQWVNALRQRLMYAGKSSLQMQRQRCEMLRQSLLNLDPTAVLQRGYAVAFQDNGQVVRSTLQLQPDQSLRLTFADGQAIARIESIHPDPPQP